MSVSGEPDHHRVVATMIERRRLVELVMVIERDGHVSSFESTTLLDDLPAFLAL